MTNEEINRYIHVEIMGNANWSPCRCCMGIECGCAIYTDDDSPRSLLNEVVAKVGTSEVSLFLRAAPACINSTALELATACYESHRHMTPIKDKSEDKN